MTLHDDTRASAEPSDEPLVEWERAGRRLLRTAGLLGGLALVAWVVTSAVGGEWSLRRLGNLLGLGLAIVFLAEVWIAGGSALRGMLRAGERGERLSGQDVGLLPPQLRPGGRMRPAAMDLDTPPDEADVEAAPSDPVDHD